jgi:hypothetical protein
MVHRRFATYIGFRRRVGSGSYHCICHCCVVSLDLVVGVDATQQALLRRSRSVGNRHAVGRALRVMLMHRNMAVVPAAPEAAVHLQAACAARLTPPRWASSQFNARLLG